MKSAKPSAYCRESAVGASGYMSGCGISLRSLRGQSRLSMISPARSDTVTGRTKCWLCVLQSQNAGGTAEFDLPSRIQKWIRDFFIANQSLINCNL